MPHNHDRDLDAGQITRLTSADALAAFFHELGYPTDRRTTIAPGALGFGDTERQITQLELLAEDEDRLRVVFVRLKSVTAKARTDLVRTFGKDVIAEHLLVLTSDFDTLEFVLIDREQRVQRAIGAAPAPKPRPRIFAVPRRWPQQSLRIIRRLTYTMDDGLRQYEKLKTVFDAAHFSGTYFTNKALFADHFLESDERLKKDPAWKSLPGPAFEAVRRLADAAPDWIGGKPLAAAKQELYDPLWSVLGFRARALTRASDEVAPDYELADAAGIKRTVALVYPWERWLDGPDHNDAERPAENPGAAVVTLLERGDAEWVIVTNGRLWRLYSRAAHSRSTNFYEVDLRDVLLVSGLTDPNEAFRYWWLFFRLEAFLPVEGEAPAEGAAAPTVWLDRVAQGSREYAREVEAQLKKRVFYDVVPMLAQGFIHDWKSRLKRRTKLSDEELEQVRAGTLTLLYRLLFLLYAESRDLLPVREAPYYGLSLKRMKEEIGEHAGVAQSAADEKLEAEYKKLETKLYDRLADLEDGLFAAMASGRPAANVPIYNGGLFRLDPAQAADDREKEICSFLNAHKVPDYYLASAIDRLARVEDPRDTHLKFVDYKSLGVRQLGSIYEGLLEFKLRFAEEDLAVKDSKAIGDYIPLAKARGRASKKLVKQIKQGEAILLRDNSERKATGSYYTPDHIVEYIVENTVGPVLKRKTEALVDEFRAAERTFHARYENAKAHPQAVLGHAAAGPLRARRATDPLAKPTDADFRAFALAETYEKHKALVEKLFDLKVLDPAMGSGHFLVEAVDFITDELLAFLNRFPVNPVMAALERTREAILESLREQGIETDEHLRRQLTDVHLLKRHVLKRCIYGVDLNPLATELAKVSLWLDAFTLGAPLSFLDHHLRPGNSLISAWIPEMEQAAGIGAGTQGEMWAVSNEPILRAVKNVLTIARLADTTASEVSESKLAFDAARKSLSGYADLLNILVAKHFGHARAVSILKHGADLDLRSREAFLASLNEADRKLVAPVDTLARKRSFFHWDLEFPEVYYRFSGVGEARIERRPQAEAGFDVLVGNPPWGADQDTPEREWARTTYASARRGIIDTFALFVDLALHRLKAGGTYGLLLPDIFLLKNYPGIRELVIARSRIASLVHWGMPFSEVSLDVCSICATYEEPTPDHVVLCVPHVVADDPARSPANRIPQAVFATNKEHRFNLGLSERLRSDLTAAEILGPRMGELFTIREGVHSGNVRERLFLDVKQSRHCRPLLFGRDEIQPMRLTWKGKWIELDPAKFDKAAGDYFNLGDPALYGARKLVVRRTGDRVLAAVDYEGLYCSNNYFLCVPTSDVSWADSLYCALVLNSTFATWYFRAIQPRAGRLFAELKITHLTDIPIPFLREAGASEWRDTWASRIEAANTDSPENLQRLVACFDAELSQRVQERSTLELSFYRETPHV